MVVHPLHTGLAYSFLLESPDGLFLVDSGSPGRERAVLDQMEILGRGDLRLIWITHAHYDHYGSAAALRRLTGAKIGVHPADAGFLTRGESPLGQARGRGRVLKLAQALLLRLRPLPAAQPDFTAEGGSRLNDWGLPALILHTPGHTPGHSCILLDSGTAFAGDLIARNPKTRLQDLLATDWNHLPGSLARLRAAHPNLVYTGHSTQPLDGEAMQNLGKDR